MEIRRYGGIAGDEHIIPALELRNPRSDAFAQKTLDMIPLHSAAELFAHRKSDAQLALTHKQKHQFLIGAAFALAVDKLERRILLQRIDSFQDLPSVTKRSVGR